jgi:hypothetical protein
LKIKLKGRHFDTNVVIEAELQVALNTLTEHGLQEEFKKGQNNSVFLLAEVNIHYFKE